MKEMKTREIIIGLVTIIILLIIALVLVIKRYPMDINSSADNNKISLVQETVDTQVVEEEPIVDDGLDYIAINNEASITQEPDMMGVEAANPNAVYTENLRNSKKYVRSVLYKVVNDDKQMAELYNAWNDYKLDTVSDLIRLERIRAITDSLDQTGYYYYYGAINNKGIPEGTGLAVYEDNTYYFGGWHNGMRDGDGMWIQIFPDATGIVDQYTGVLEHQYSGCWKNDLPNGNGQEHFTYDVSQITIGATIANVMGSFKDGYYNGDMLIMLIHNNGTTEDWYGTAKNGIFNYIDSTTVTAAGGRPVWTRGANGDYMGMDAHYMVPGENIEWGISSLKK